MSIRTLFLYCLIGVGCRQHLPEPPVILYLPDELFAGRPDSVVLGVKGETADWQFFLLSDRQPISLTAYLKGHTWVIPLSFARDFYQGPASLCCAHGNRRFFYPLLFVADTALARHIVKKEYRSPKTVNPDSSFWQESICFDLDISRNILPWPRRHKDMITPYFYSDSIRLSPVARTIVVQPPLNISAVYVQPGSADQLSVRGVFDKERHCFFISADNIRDSYGNLIADGTSVCFLYTSEGPVQEDSLLHQVEAPVWRGSARTKLEGNDVKKINIYARIGDIRSRIIQINGR